MRQPLTTSAFRATAVARGVDSAILVACPSRAGLLVCGQLLSGVLVGRSFGRFSPPALPPAGSWRVIRVRVRIFRAAFEVALVRDGDFAAWPDGLAGEDYKQRLVRVDVVAEDRADDRVWVAGLEESRVSRERSSTE